MKILKKLFKKNKRYNKKMIRKKLNKINITLYIKNKIPV
jgi:hypothetical protein